MRCTAVGACWVELGPLGAGAGVRAGAGSRFPRRSALGGAPMGRGGRHLMPVRQGAGSLWRIPAARGAPEETDPSAQHTTDRSHKARPLTRASLAGRSNGARAHARPGAGCTSRTYGLRVGAVRGRARRCAVAPSAKSGPPGWAPWLQHRCTQREEGGAALSPLLRVGAVWVAALLVRLWGDACRMPLPCDRRRNGKGLDMVCESSFRRKTGQTVLNRR